MENDKEASTTMGLERQKNEQQATTSKKGQKEKGVGSRDSSVNPDSVTNLGA